ncbi:MAG: methylenetetrahydrofolate reductase [Pseudomonadota bacterium]|jgi:methylenetetrahydrofolate reductase (NADPH)
MNQTLTLSCEFFPPRTDEGIKNFRLAREQLLPLKPTFFSVTFGAGGSTQDQTFETVVEIQTQTQIPAAPHLSCVGSSKENIRKLLNNYQSKNISRIVALRGDRPSGMGGTEKEELHYANELVDFIRAETGDYFHIEVAAYPEFHPQARSAKSDLAYFKQKVEAGANSAITQYFYNADAYFKFVDDCTKVGISIPIVPGIMPISNFSQLARFSESCGAEIPRWLQRRLQDCGDDITQIQAIGLDVVTALCERLLQGGACGLHFYTLNRSHATLEISKRLGLLK